MRLVITSLLPCRLERAWGEVLTSRLLLEVSTPLAAIRPLPGEELPRRWSAGQTVRCRVHLFGVIPLGTRSLHFERIDPSAHEVQTRESDRLVRRWDHLIHIEAAGPGQCRYRDEIDLDAGWLTPKVWLFAWWFYRHRQRRWLAVARRLEAGNQGLGIGD
jgi:hypothetical protein